MFLLGWRDICDGCVCGNDNRKGLGIVGNGKQCYQKCIYTLGCYAVEYWPGNANNINCFNCIDPSKHIPYDGKGYPPLVSQQGIPQSLFRLFTY